MSGQADSVTVWSCHDVDVPHSEYNTHERGVEDGLPFYPLTEDGLIRVTICQKCHGRIPGHMMNIRPDDLDQYFKIQSTDELFSTLPSGYVGTGTSVTFHQRLFEAAMSPTYSLYPNHAGHTLQASLIHQWGDENLQPPKYHARIDKQRKRLEEL